jgi:hypothetical protein
MTIEIITFTILSFLIGAHLRWRPYFVKHEKLIFLTTFLLIFLALSVLSFIEYRQIISSEPPTLYLAPPYVEWSEYFKTLLLRVFAPYLLSGALAIIAYFVSTKISFFYLRLGEMEPLLIATTIFLMRHPYWLIYLPTLIILATIALAVGTTRFGSTYRFSLENLWLPAGIATCLLIPLLRQIPFLAEIGLVPQNS